jgi:hypothetical protein
MRSLQLLNLVVMRLFEVLDAVSAVAAQALHRINNTAEISKQADLFLYDVSTRRARDYTTAMILPSALASRLETSPPFLAVPYLLGSRLATLSCWNVRGCGGMCVDGARAEGVR